MPVPAGWFLYLYAPKHQGHFGTSTSLRCSESKGPKILLFSGLLFNSSLTRLYWKSRIYYEQQCILRLLALFIHVQVRKYLLFEFQKDPKMQGCSRETVNLGAFLTLGISGQCAWAKNFFTKNIQQIEPDFRFIQPIHYKWANLKKTKKKA